LDFNHHPKIHGKHAFLSPSQYHWINYTPQKLEARFFAQEQAARGTALHALAHNAIKLKVHLSNKNKTIALYVNDAIKYGMESEIYLYYSENCFGQADALGFNGRKLRIHDLKTGITPAKETQLEVYGAIFCLEYGISPFDIDIEMRIYQNEEKRIFDADPEVIARIMDTIVEFDARIEFMKERGIE
jgi:hypothetical protein